MAESTATPRLGTRPERCSNCNAKLPDTPVSLCPYCAMPILGAPEASEGGESPNAGRIARVREHEDFAAAMDWSPPESFDYRSGSARIWWGQLAIGAGVVGVVLGALLAGGNPAQHVLGWLGILLLAAGIYGRLSGAAMKKKAVEMPLLRRPGLVVDRRSDTVLRGWSGSTTYYFTIELEGGVRGEFAYPGRGAQEDPYVNNLPGVAYTRGETLLHFRHIRV